MKTESLKRGIVISGELDKIERDQKEITNCLPKEIRWVNIKSVSNNEYLLRISDFEANEKLQEATIEYLERIERILEKMKKSLEKEFENL